MSVSILSPCLCCEGRLPGDQCSPRDRSRCDMFLDYIQKLHRIKASRLLIGELKNLISH